MIPLRGGRRAYAEAGTRNGSMRKGAAATGDHPNRREPSSQWAYARLYRSGAESQVALTTGSRITALAAATPRSAGSRPWEAVTASRHHSRHDLVHALGSSTASAAERIACGSPTALPPRAPTQPPGTRPCEVPKQETRA